MATIPVPIFACNGILSLTGIVMRDHNQVTMELVYLRAEGHGGSVTIQSVGEPPHILEDVSSIIKSGGEIRPSPEGQVENAQTFAQAPKLAKQLSAEDQGIDVIGVMLAAFRHRSKSLFHLAETGKRFRATKVGIRKSWIMADGIAESGNSLWKTVECLEDNGAVVVGLGQSGLRPNGVLVSLQSLFPTTEFLKGIAPIVVSPGMIGREAECALVSLQSLLGTPELRKKISAVVVRRRMARVCRQRSIIRFERLIGRSCGSQPKPSNEIGLCETGSQADQPFNKAETLSRASTLDSKESKKIKSGTVVRVFA
jgi:hypothetical protein